MYTKLDIYVFITCMSVIKFASVTLYYQIVLSFQLILPVSNFGLCFYMLYVYVIWM